MKKVYLISMICLNLMLLSVSNSFAANDTQAKTIPVQVGTNSTANTQQKAPNTSSDADWASNFDSGADPFTEIQRVNTMMRQWFDQSPWGQSGRNKTGGQSSSPVLYEPAMDVVESPTDYILTMEVPGIAKENLSIDIKDGVLTVRGEQKSEEIKDQNQKGMQYHVQERRYGTFERSMRLPKNADIQKIHAEHKNGILTIKFPKTAQEASKAVKVSIE